MNKEYCVFFANPEAFIEKIILTDENICVYHPNNSNPTIYENTKENLINIKKRLQSQAEELAKNSEIVTKKNPRSKRLNYMAIFCMMFSLLLIIINFLVMPQNVVLMLSASVGITVASATTIYNSIKNKNQSEELHNYKFYIKNIKKIKNQILEDENMIRYLSDDAKDLLQNKELDIIIADKLIEEMPKDFAMIKQRSIINDGLNKPVSFNYKKYQKEKVTQDDNLEQPVKKRIKK